MIRFFHHPQRIHCMADNAGPIGFHCGAANDVYQSLSVLWRDVPPGADAPLDKNEVFNQQWILETLKHQAGRVWSSSTVITPDTSVLMKPPVVVACTS